MFITKTFTTFLTNYYSLFLKIRQYCKQTKPYYLIVINKTLKILRSTGNTYSTYKGNKLYKQ